MVTRHKGVLCELRMKWKSFKQIKNIVLQRKLDICQIEHCVEMWDIWIYSAANRKPSPDRGDFFVALHIQKNQ